MAEAAAAAAAAAAVERTFDGVEEWTDEEHQRYLDSLGDAEEHPLFRDISEAEADEFGEAMRAADVADDADALGKATRKKDRGNAAFRKGPDFFGNALRHYKDALTLVAAVEGDSTMRAERAALEANLHANIAAVYMKRRVWHRALGAAEEALRLAPGHAKASFRRATCLSELGRHAAAVEACREALATEGGAGSLAVQRLLADAEAAAARSARRRAEVEARREARGAAVTAAREACRARGIRIGRPLMRDMVRTLAAVPSVDEDGVMHWPVTLLFPARAVSELVQSCPESATVGELLATLLPSTSGGAPAPWDAAGEHLADTALVFYRAEETPQVPPERLWASEMEEDEGEDGDGDGDDDGAGARRAGAGGGWVRTPLDVPLALVLMQPDFVLPGMPVLRVVPPGSEAEAAMRRENGEAGVPVLRMPE